MKLRLLSLMLFITGLVSGQQLDNMDFENWTYDPLSKGYTIINGPWDGGNSCTVTYPKIGPDTICTTFITRQTDAMVGKYSIKIQTPADQDPGSGGFVSYDRTQASQLVSFTFAPIAFTGYYKLIKGQKDDGADITVDFYDSDLNTVKFGSGPLGEAKIWTKFSVTLFNIPPSSAIQFVEVIFHHAVNAVDPTSPPSINTYLMLDGLSFSYSASEVMDEAIKDGLRYTDGIIDITQMHQVKNMSMYNLNGMKCGTIQDVYDTRTQPNGIYIVSFEQNGAPKTFKLPVHN